MVFISYSWDSNEHQQKVAELVKSLQRDGVNVIWDSDMKLGERIPLFMEKSIKKCDYIIFICTPLYKIKADKRDGGVGYETNIITGELYGKIDETKFIPVLFDGDWKKSMPYWANGKLGINLNSKSNTDKEYKKLLDALINAPTNNNSNVVNNIYELLFMTKENLITLIDVINHETDANKVLSDLQINYRDIYKISALCDLSISEEQRNCLDSNIQKWNDFVSIHNNLSKVFNIRNTGQFTQENKIKLNQLEQEWNLCYHQLLDMCNDAIVLFYK